MNNPIRAVGYLCAKDQTQEKGESLANFVREQNWQLLGLFADESSAHQAAVRPGLKLALSTLERQRGNALVLLDLADLAYPVAVLAEIGSSLINANAKVILAHHSLQIQASEMGHIVNFLALATQAERELRKERVRKGLSESAKKGKIIGAPRFGTKLGEGDVIYEIKQMRSRGLSYRQICEALNGAGVRSARGQMWHPITVQRLCDRKGLTH